MILPLVLALLAQTADTAERRVEGRVVRGTRAGPVALPNQWVVLHRISTGRSGPIDSVRTGANGQYAFRYRASADTSSIYFATTSHGGIVYPTSPLRSPRISGDEAMITVFDTASGPVPIKVGGRHLIIGAPQANGRRPVGEVYDLENDSTVTLIARDSTTPVYTVHLPEHAEAFRLNSSGEFGTGAVSRNGSSVALFAPLSPGIRQFAFTYELPAKAFPLVLPAEKPIGVFEILIEDPTADVRAPALREVESASMEGRTFRRFLSQNLEATSVVRVSVPRIATADRQKIYIAVLLAFLGTMGVALLYAAKRPRVRRVRRVRRVQAPVVAPPPEPRSRVLVRAIAELDDAFDATPPSDAKRAEYDARRATLKAQLADALAAERAPT